MEEGSSMGANKVLHNIPTFSTYALGAIIILFLNWVFSVAFILYCIFSTLWFMRFICAHCPHYDNRKCPSGYAFISAKLFKKKDSKEFNEKFKRHLGVVFPSWIIPVVAGLYSLYYEFSLLLLLLLFAFIVIGFIILPVITKRYGCEDCNLKDSCPRMAGFKKRRKKGR